MKTHLVWFRNDLRVIDNPALTYACNQPDTQVIALFIATPKQWQTHHMSARQASLIFDRVVELRKELAQLNIPLLYHVIDDFNDSIPLIHQICQEHHVSHLFYNRQYEYNECKRDRCLKQKLQENVECVELDGNVFLTPHSIHNKQGKMYKVFTPFRNAFLNYFLQQMLHLHPTPEARNQQKVTLVTLSPFNYPQESYAFFQPHTQDALEQLQEFCAEHVIDYGDKRDIPYLNYTSRLSAYLTIGMISVKQCFDTLSKEHPSFWKDKNCGAFIWFNELIWREFYQHLMLAHPRLCQHKPFIDWTDKIIWKNDQKQFDLWKNGQTGYPIIDAAMRQLNQTGWMHNRLRMITASFLVKDLLIDWRWGEQYFMSQLTDGDLAANNGGWQWAASTGTDAVPYFRIFNPTTQGKRFDSKGDFIRQWIPELKDVPDRYIHTPYIWAEKMGKKLTYPNPIVIHDNARKETLTAFEKAKK